MNYEENIYVCEICECTSTEMDVMKIHVLEHGEENVVVVEQQKHAANDIKTVTEQRNLENPVIIKWTNEMTLQLISLVEKFDNDFQRSVKQFVWKKIAAIINKSHGTNLTAVQADTKWKGLKRTYQEVKKHNSKSGNSITKWKFFDVMHSFLFKKPEINPVATCSSQAGLVKRQDPMEESSQENCEQLNETPKKRCLEDSSSDYKSLFATKRKAVSCANIRHKEKMEKTEKFLTLMERFVVAVEKQTNKGEK